MPHTFACNDLQDHVCQFLLAARDELRGDDYRSLLAAINGWLSSGSEINRQAQRMATETALRGSNQDRDEDHALLTGLDMFLLHLGTVLPPGPQHHGRLFYTEDWLRDVQPTPVESLNVAAHASSGESEISMSENDLGRNESERAPVAAGREGMESGSEEPALAADHSIISTSIVGSYSRSAFSNATGMMHSLETDDPVDPLSALEPNQSDDPLQLQGEPGEDESLILQAWAAGNYLPDRLASFEADRGTLAGEEESKDEQRRDEVDDKGHEPDAKRAKR